MQARQITTAGVDVREGGVQIEYREYRLGHGDESVLTMGDADLFEMPEEVVRLSEEECRIMAEHERRKAIFAQRMQQVRAVEQAGGSFRGFLPSPVHPLGNRAARRGAKKAGRG